MRTKIKIPQNQRFHGIFDGRSDWIRTSGHLNPIQVLYQTEPHPGGVANFFAYHKTRKRLLLIATNLLLFPQNALRWHFAGALCSCNAFRLIRSFASKTSSPLHDCSLFPKSVSRFSGALRLTARRNSLRLFAFLQAGKSHPLRDCSLFQKTQAFSEALVVFLRQF